MLGFADQLIDPEFDEDWFGAHPGNLLHDAFENDLQFMRRRWERERKCAEKAAIKAIEEHKQRKLSEKEHRRARRIAADFIDQPIKPTPDAYVTAFYPSAGPQADAHVIAFQKELVQNESFRRTKFLQSTPHNPKNIWDGYGDWCLRRVSSLQGSGEIKWWTEW
jgi:hypothetical protein